jgi:hypothetical protein
MVQSSLLANIILMVGNQMKKFISQPFFYNGRVEGLVQQKVDSDQIHGEIHARS